MTIWTRSTTWWTWSATTRWPSGRTSAWAGRWSGFDWIGASHGREPFLSSGDVPQPFRLLKGFASPLEFVNVAEGLLRRGYSEAAARKILGGNWLRLFGEVWRDDR